MVAHRAWYDVQFRALQDFSVFPANWSPIPRTPGLGLGISAINSRFPQFRPTEAPASLAMWVLQKIIFNGAQAWNLARCTKYRVPDAMHDALSAWSQMLCTDSYGLWMMWFHAPGTRNQVPGAMHFGCLVPGAMHFGRPVDYGALKGHNFQRKLTPAWHLVLGTRWLAQNSWYLVLGTMSRARFRWKQAVP